MADPIFARRLRSELRGRQARATRSLRWFDLALPLGPIRIVHDDELIHLVTNDPAHFDEVAHATLGFEPPAGESGKVRASAEAVLEGKRRGSDIAFLGLLPRFQQAGLDAAVFVGCPSCRFASGGAGCRDCARAQPGAICDSVPPGGASGLVARPVFRWRCRGEGAGAPDGGRLAAAPCLASAAASFRWDALRARLLHACVPRYRRDGPGIAQAVRFGGIHRCRRVFCRLPVRRAGNFSDRFPGGNPGRGGRRPARRAGRHALRVLGRRHRRFRHLPV